MNKYVLENGLTIYCYVDKEKHSTQVNLVIRYGATYSDFLINGKQIHVKDGMAHFLEHFLLEHGSHGVIFSELNKLQMTSNGATSDIYTNHYFNCVEKLEQGLEILLTSIHTPEWTIDNIDETKKAIYEEIRRSLDNKYRRANNVIVHNSFVNIPYINGLGSIEDVENINLETAKLCYDAFYQPSNEFIVIAGNFDEDKVVNDIKKIYDQLYFSNHQVELIKINEPNQVRKDFEEIIMPTGRTVLEIAYKINHSHYTDLEQYKMDFYNHIMIEMNFGVSSSFYKKLIENKVITGNIGVSTRNLFDFSIVVFHVMTEQEEVFKDALEDTLHNLVYDPEWFQLYVNQLKMTVGLRKDSINSITGSFIQNVLSFNYEKLDEVDVLEKFNLEECKSFYNNIDFSNKTIVRIINND